MDQLFEIYQQLLWLPPMVTYTGSALATFLLAFAKTFQTKNIVAGHTKSAYFMSWTVTALEVTNVTLIVAGGWWALLSTGFGGSLGVVLSMKLHGRIYGGVHSGQRNKQPDPGSPSESVHQTS